MLKVTKPYDVIRYIDLDLEPEDEVVLEGKFIDGQQYMQDMLIPQVESLIEIEEIWYVVRGVVRKFQKDSWNIVVSLQRTNW